MQDHNNCDKAKTTSQDNKSVTHLCTLKVKTLTIVTHDLGATVSL